MNNVIYQNELNVRICAYVCEVEYMLIICASEMGSAEITSLLEK